MMNLKQIGLLSLLLLGICSESGVCAINGTVPSSLPSNVSKPGTTLAPIAPPPTPTAPPPVIPALKARPKPIVPYENQPRENLYSFPGVVAWRDGQWIGKENLYNIPKEIGVDVEIIKPEGFNIPLTEGAIKAEIMSVLQRGGIIPSSIFHVGTSPLPFIHILLMVQPIEKGYVALCAFRFFEETRLGRINLEKTLAWQVITWEKQEVLVAPPESLQAQVLKILSDIGVAFIDRFKADGSGEGPKGYIKR